MTTPFDPAVAAYDVGYGKPPVEHQFQPGQSGNPNGRPRKVRPEPTCAMEALRQILETPKVVLEGGREREITAIDLIGRSLWEMLIKGSHDVKLKAIRQLQRIGYFDFDRQMRQIEQREANFWPEWAKNVDKFLAEMDARMGEESSLGSHSEEELEEALEELHTREAELKAELARRKAGGPSVDPKDAPSPDGSAENFDERSASCARHQDPDALFHEPIESLRAQEARDQKKAQRPPKRE